MTKQVLTDEILSKVKEERLPSSSFTPSTPPTNGEPPTQVINETYSGSLDDAATLLLNILTPSIRSLAMELADITLKIPRWQLLLGSMLAQYEGGCLAAPSIDPSWRQIEVAIGRSFCRICKREFTPKRFGQLFCSTPCGDVARGTAIEEAKTKKREEDLAFRDRIAVLQREQAVRR